ncbi:2'-5' RNA ligase family protein [Streptomyces graminilatus]|uniref:2'-5' RNA ligase family protein n=1 Tax=Streptomyces graminilatus TaxID=1464070 RepID=UPI0006E33727|nr:2'-5' RNA ligase family protein [Streptomyces graminilatus]
MRKFVPQLQNAPWPDGARVLHAYLVPDLSVDHALARLAAACREAMRPYPITLLDDGLLHATVEMVADTTADRITAAERQDLVEALRGRLADMTPFQVTAGSPIANKAGALLDLGPDEPLIDLKGRVQDAFVEARGPAVIQHDGGRHHMSLGYSWDTADSDPLQSALRKISPSHVPFHVDRVHLLEVQFREHTRHGGKSAWELSWDPVAVIRLGSR